MKIQQIIELESQVISQVIADGLAAGYTFSVHDGEEMALKNSADKETILQALFSVDEEALLILKDGKKFARLSLVHGNDGWDVISDYAGYNGQSDEVEEFLKPTLALVERLQAE